ncbi:hypothetical protein GCM10009744_59340 [Kribbella alba]|uniref:Tyr recombinase domain-containing protein n=1 Tax=Kribbella alba TaxID=190197 RepID=A0ABP4RQZ5_9ACTN
MPDPTTAPEVCAARPSVLGPYSRGMHTRWFERPEGDALVLHKTPRLACWKTRRKPPHALSTEEREQWFELLSQDVRAVRADLVDLCNFTLATGERIGETLAIRWADVSRDTCEVNCSHQIQRRKGHGLVRVRVKSEAGDRVLLLRSGRSTCCAPDGGMGTAGGGLSVCAHGRHRDGLPRSVVDRLGADGLGCPTVG